MKQLFTTAGVLFSMTAFAQVGINNTSPKATLDITAKTTGSKPEGLIVPQLTGDQIRAASTGTTPVYGSAQKGLILFASAADTAPAGATANITAPGYYYFDGSVWQKIVTGSSLNTSLNSGNIYVGNASNVATAVTPSGDVTISNSGVTAIGTGKVTSSQIADATVANADLASGAGGIYKGDGSLSGNTTVTQAANTLAFTSTATAGTSHFTVDGSTLNVDAVNNRVGIGTAAPKSYFHASTPTAGGLIDAGIFSINNCGGSCGQPTARNIVLNNLNGTNGLFASIDFVPSLDPTASSGASIQGIDRDATNNYAGLVFYTRNATNYASRMIIKSSGRVGIGTSAESPQATLDVKAISSGTSPEGIIAPRLSLTALQGYTYDGNQTGAIVYVNSVSGTPTGQTANVTAVGYYYFDGTNWLKMTTGASVTDATTTAKGIVQLAGDLSGTAASPSIAGSAVTSAKIADGTVANADLASGTGGIYKGDGSLSGNTTVTQGTNTLAFTSNATNGFSVDGTTFSVDAANNRVGIGTAAPSAMLHIYGTSGDHLRITNSSSDWALGSENAGGQNGIPGQSSFNITNRTGNFRAMTIGTDNSFRLGGSISVGSAAFSIDGPTNKIGIGVNVPNATLDVRAASNGSTPEGIIAPRLSLTALQGYTYDGNQTGAMVYVNSASGTPTGQTANVTATGYYYFDGSNWQKVANGASVTDATTSAKGIVQLAGDLSGTAASPSIATSAVTSAKIADGAVANADLASGAGGIYKGDGSLSGNTTVAQVTNTLAFTSTATAGTSHFTVDGTTLNVDAVNNRVGIGTSTPQKPLHVNANNNSIRFENLPSLSSGSSSTALVVDANGDIYKNNTVSAEGQILRIGINGTTYNTTEAGLRFNSNNDATEMGSAPNGAPNYINTIVGATISEGTTLTAGNGTPARTTDQIVLQPGVYKMQVRLVGYFASANNGNIVNFKATANNNEYSYAYFSNPTTTSGTYYYEDFINITGSAQAIDFTISANSDFTVMSRLSPTSGQSYRSLIMIQKLR